jgi:hypothetical protein
VTRLRQIMLEELRRRNYAESTIHAYIHTVEHFSRHFHRSPDQLALADGNVAFRWRDSAHGNKKRIMTLAVEEFLRRFLLHLLPRGFVRIRNFGFLANRRRAELLPVCFRLLQQSDQPAASTNSPAALPIHSLWQCPLCVRNHAGRRAPLGRATSSPISASSQPVRRLNPHLQPRISLVLRRAYWFCVSHSSQCSMVVRFRLSDAPPHDHALCDPLLKPKHSDHNGKLAYDQDRLIQIQIP